MKKNSNNFIHLKSALLDLSDLLLGNESRVD